MKAASRTFDLLKNGKPVELQPPKLRFTSLREEILKRRQVVEFGYELLKHSEPTNTVDSYLQSAFPGCIYEAYKGHLHLIMRPDDVWIGLMTVFSNYISQHSEELKDFFKPMDVTACSLVETVSTKPLANWMLLIKDLVREIPISEDIKTAMVPDFSTTTDLDRAVGGLCLLGGMKKFAKYGFCGSCGIPKVTLEGTSDDWGLLLQKIKFFEEIADQTGLKELSWWADLLRPILRKFFDSYNGDVDSDWWQQCIHLDNMCGSGIQGWTLAFSPWESGVWRLQHPDDIKLTGHYGEFTNMKEFNGPSTVQVQVNYYDGQHQRSICLYGGMMMSSCDPIQCTIRPNVDLAVFSIPIGSVLEEGQKPKIRVVQSETARLRDETGLPAELRSAKHEHPIYLIQLGSCYCRRPDVKLGYKCFKCEWKLCDTCIYAPPVQPKEKAIAAQN